MELKKDMKNIIKNQIEKIRQVRNDDTNNYPKAVETLWVLFRNKEFDKVLEEEKKELKIEPSHLIDIPDLEQWDTIFKFTLEKMAEYEGLSL